MKIGRLGLTIIKSARTIGSMDQETRMQAVLTRLWELQAEAGLSDADLARRMNVDQALISRTKRRRAKTFGMKFFLGAVEVFPELGFLLSSDLSIIRSDLPIVKDEEQAS